MSKKPQARDKRAISKRALHRQQVAAASPAAPGPKFTKARKHKQHVHPLKDEFGAYTYVGREAFSPDVNPQHARRIWLAGISAQRGY